MRSITAISDWGSPSAESAVFSDCNSLLTEALCATLEGGMSARAVVPELAEFAENGESKTVGFAGDAVASAGGLSALAGDAIAEELPAAGVAVCAKGLTAELVAVV